MFIEVTQVAEVTQEEGDSNVAGLYFVDFRSDVTGVPPGELAGRVLDIFHAHQGIENLEDFEIFVLDAHKGCVEADEEYETGTHADAGVAYKINSADQITAPGA